MPARMVQTHGASTPPSMSHTDAAASFPQTVKSDGLPFELIAFVDGLRDRGIPVYETQGRAFPAEATMHDRAAVVPAVIVSPRCEEEVIKTVSLLASLNLYSTYPVSVRSGGHGYSNEASCSGIMISMRSMTGQRITDDVLSIEPGCILGQLVPALASKAKAVPHGDCFGVGAGGHFLTAGWDIALARRYGLGCQSVLGGRVVLWDGSKVDVNENSHPDLLHAMRGGAAARVGVVTEIRLRLLDQPPLVSWRFQSLSKSQLATCVSQHAFAHAATLPRDVSISFRFHFETELICSFNVVSLLSVAETLDLLKKHLGSEVASLMLGLLGWHDGPLLALRMIPAAEELAADPMRLAEVTPEDLHQDPLQYWKPAVSAREMASSYFTSISHWVVPDCEELLLNLYGTFQSVQDHPARERMYALVIQGGGRMTELQHQCSMPLGQALARFELHWDDPEDEQWSRQFTVQISAAMERTIDRVPGRPYRGDIWLKEQGNDDDLDVICKAYDRRFSLRETVSLVDSQQVVQKAAEA
ncbi:6-hydroxy-d-nicotine oxidase [Paraphaeosphaeria minitans]|uniref:6-hydroxy-d-nicotine oxidase n=1 Tax=Paraphaeosphaeria minitans TaxID=565426 RepID=A0A9P6KKH4_9PLEO|nr:6-hydroxy-d-nicotine oxidase [Paraphaeosphaeria minitans]